MKRLTAILLCALLLLTGCASGAAPDDSTSALTGTAAELPIPEAPTQGETQTAAETAVYNALTQPGQTEPTTVIVTPASDWTTQATAAADANMTTKISTAAAASTTTKATTTTTKAATTTTKAATTVSSNTGSGEIRSVWLSYYALTQPDGGVSESAFQAQYDALFKDIKAYGIDVLFLHVRAYSDAIYPSQHAPWSAYLTGTQGKNPGYDPLGILCQLAQKHGISVHAWLNPFRITEGESYAGLSADNPALAHIKAGDGQVGLANGAWYWNPAVTETHAHTYNAAKELLAKYPIDGIHLDDYFYPTTAAAFDAPQYSAYTAAGGQLSLADWRRSSINAFVSGLYRTVKNVNQKLIVSISPTGNINRNYGELYADTSLWMQEAGYADWMIPQIYFGFSHPTLPYESIARDWAALPRHSGLKLMVGLAFYKTGKEDKYAGAARDEWLNNSDLIARQLQCTRGIPGYGGFALYAAEALFGSGLTDIAKLERTNLQKLLN